MQYTKAWAEYPKIHDNPLLFEFFYDRATGNLDVNSTDKVCARCRVRPVAIIAFRRHSWVSRIGPILHNPWALYSHSKAAFKG